MSALVTRGPLAIPGVHVSSPHPPVLADVGWSSESPGGCMAMKHHDGNEAQRTPAIGFTHINCPVVSVDLNADDYTDAAEELFFPDLWLDGPVIV